MFNVCMQKVCMVKRSVIHLSLVIDGWKGSEEGFFEMYEFCAVSMVNGEIKVSFQMKY
jgi:hypothetical protein